MKLLTVSNTKTLKNKKKGYLTGILHFAPGDISGYEVCPGRSKGCFASCLFTAGRNKFEQSQNAKVRRTLEFFENHDWFMETLVRDIQALVRKAKREGLTPAIRLNGTSDLLWERIPVPALGACNLMEAFPDIQFYDYTKILGRKIDHIPNYYLLFSKSEENLPQLRKAIDRGMNIAVVFDGFPDKYPPSYLGLPVIDGDETDLRFIETDKQICAGLTAKGEAKADYTGFVVRPADLQMVS